jgi:hypothetical protein
MEEVLLFLRSYELWIYLLLGGAALVVFRRLAGAQKEIRSALYGLEREKAQAKFNAGLAVLVFLGLLGLGEFSLVTFVQPQVQAQVFLPTPTLNLEKTILVETNIPLSNPGLEATPTPTLNIQPVSEGCIKGALEWVNPVDGMELNGTVDLRFIVQVQNLGFYKFEYSTAGTDLWQTIAAGNELIREDKSGGAWVTDVLIPGDYRLRLVAINSNNETIAVCAINVRVTAVLLNP